jgi:uncharacterized protein YdaU (DUF1376 family)
MDYYKRYMGDYQRDTGDLSLAQHGAYSVLLDHYYSVRKPLPAAMEKLHRLCRATTKAEQDAVETIANEFFPVSSVDGLRHNWRADEEIEKWEEFAEENRQKGKLGGRPKKNPGGNPSGNPQGNPTGSGGDNPEETQRLSNGFEKGAISKPAQNPIQNPNPNPGSRSLSLTPDAGAREGDVSVKGKGSEGPDHAWRDVGCDAQAHEAWLGYRSQAGETVTPAQRLVNAKFLAGKGSPEAQRAFIDELIRLGFKRLHDPVHGNGNKPAKEGRTHAGLPIVNP